MSVKAITWAVEFPAENASEKAVLLILANYCDGNGECFPGQQSISEQAAVSKRTVIRVLDSLEKRGIIERKERRRRDGSRSSDVIVLVAFQQGANLSPSDDPRCQSVQPKVTPCPTQGDTVSPPTTFEPSVTRQKTQARDGLPSQTECERFAAAYPADGMVNVAAANLPMMLSRIALRLGGMEALTRAASRYAARVSKADTKPRSLANWLADTALVDECAAQDRARLPTTTGEWKSFVGYFQRKGEWCAPGPPPGQPSCQAPADVLAEFGYSVGDAA